MKIALWRPLPCREWLAANEEQSILHIRRKTTHTDIHTQNNIRGTHVPARNMTYTLKLSQRALYFPRGDNITIFKWLLRWSKVREFKTTENNYPFQSSVNETSLWGWCLDMQCTDCSINTFTISDVRHAVTTMTNRGILLRWLLMHITLSQRESQSSSISLSITCT